MTVIDDGDWIVASKPKRGDGLDVFVADFGNAGSYVNAVWKQSEAKDREAQERGLPQWGRKLRGSREQRWRPALGEERCRAQGYRRHDHDEVDDDDTEEYDDQEVEQHHDDLGGGQDLADDEEYAVERDQEHED